MKTFFEKRLDLILLLLILLVALGFRLYKIDNPISEWHSWRQADTAAVARNLAQDFNLLLPRYDDLSNIQTGQYNPEGLRMVEFPIYNALFAMAFKIAPVLPIEIYGRLVSLFFSLILIAVIYFIALEEAGRIPAFFSALIFAIYPFFVFYSRAVLPEMTALSFMFLGIYFLYKYKPTGKQIGLKYLSLFLFSAVFAAISILIKPTTIFFCFTLLYLFIKKYGLLIIKKISPYIYFLIVLAPFILWRLWVARFPVGIPANDWLLFSVNTPNGMEPIFFRPAFFRWIFHERILNLILGGYLATFFITGIIAPASVKKNSVLIFSIAASSLIYLFTFQGGNVQHDYYQTLILPSLSLFSGIGISFFLSANNILKKALIIIPTIIFILIFSAFISYEKVKDYYQPNRELVNIARIVRDFTQPEDKIVTDTLGDTTLLYLSERKGFPAVTDDLSKLSDMGISYFVTQKSDVAEEVEKIFPTVFESDKVYIFKL